MNSTVIILLCIVFLVLGLVLGYIFYKNHNEPTIQPPPQQPEIHSIKNDGLTPQDERFHPIPRGSLIEARDKNMWRKRRPFGWRGAPRYHPEFDSLPGSLSSKRYFQPYNFNTYNIPFFSSVNAFAPFPEIDSSWEKIGLLTTKDSTDSTILNLYRRPIAPLQDLFEYAVQDKNGFVIPLSTTSYLEDGDIIPFVQGKESMGEWKARIYVNNKWVWM